MIILICRFLAICPSAQAVHMTTWLKKHAVHSVNIHDITSHYCVLGLMGPRSRELLQTVTKTSLDNVAFPYGTSQVTVIIGIRIYIIIQYAGN